MRKRICSGCGKKTGGRIIARNSTADLVARSRKPAKDEFRQRFQRSLRACLRKGFSVEECFGLVWEETLDLIPLPEPEQGPLYEEMIQWAKCSVR